MLPTQQRSSEIARFFGKFRVLKVVTQTTNELEREGCVVLIVETTHEFSARQVANTHPLGYRR